MKKTLLTICILCAAVVTANAQFVKNNFLTDYSVGQNLEKGAYALADSAAATRNPILGQWNLTVKTTDQGGENPKIAEALTYTGYVESGSGVSVSLIKSAATRVSGYSMEDANTYNTGAYYTAFMLKPTLVGSGNTGNGQDFFTVDGNTFINNQRSRIFMRRGPGDTSSNRTFSLGLSESGTVYVWDAAEFPVGSTTVLVVLKYDFSGGVVSLFVNPDVTKAELENTPVASYNVANGISATAGIRSLVLKQRTANEMLVGGIRFSDSWAQVLGQDLSSIGNNSADKGNVLSSKYYNLNGVEISEPQSTERGIIYLKKDLYENGTVETSKVIK